MIVGETGVFPWEVHPKYVEEIRNGLPNWSGKPNDLVMLCRSSDHSVPFDRTELILVQDGEDKKQSVILHVSSLRELFRGNAAPGEFKDYPDEYIPFFATVEEMLVDEFRFCRDNPISDDQFIEVYSVMRRRPDGKSIGLLHDLVWQMCAYFMLLRRCSQGEFESCIQKLERGVRKFHMDHRSHNYYDYVLDQYDLR